MKTYLVGGSVRDRLLGIVPRDTDYLVINSSDDELLAKGLVRVGQSFPIYLDTETKDEYTLAASLEEDLKRRDLTINALAIDENDKLVDLYGGEKDLRNKILRHVERENFFTDPLRVLRAARFKAQFPEFSIHPETLELMKEVAATPAYKNLLSERIIKELRRVLECPLPSVFFQTLSAVGALRPHFPEGDLKSLDQAPRKEDLQFSAFVTNLSLVDLTEMRDRLNIQNDWYEMARAWILFQGMKKSPEDLMEFFYATDAFRKPTIISKIIELGGKGLEFFEVVKDIGIKDIDSSHEGKAISQAIREKRLSILRNRN